MAKTDIMAGINDQGLSQPTRITVPNTLAIHCEQVIRRYTIELKYLLEIVQTN
jgi:hypothetical protein